jgi:hypothetical protein
MRTYGQLTRRLWRQEHHYAINAPFQTCFSFRAQSYVLARKA